MNLGQVVYRYVAGRPLTTRPGVFPYFHCGDGRWPGWRRQVLRLAGPPVVFAVQHAVASYTHLAIVAATLGVEVLRRWWRGRRFRSTYVTPTVRAIRTPLGITDVDLYVDKRLGDLVAKLAKPQSPAEVWLRERYGRWIEPVWKRPADLAMRARWAFGRNVGTRLSTAAAQFRRPQTGPTGPRIVLRASKEFLTTEQRQMVSAIIHAKIPVGDLAESWNQVGHEVRATWVPRKRPPGSVGPEALVEAFPKLAEWEFFLGLGASGKPVKVSLRDDSPHIALSAGSGAGKSTLAQLVAIQVLRRGGNVLILDRKASHRWAINVPGVDYCSKPEQMHEGLIRAAALADERNTLAFHEPEDWDPGPRLLVICEELNATLHMLSKYWARVRGKGDPKRSPAIDGLNDLSHMGRSAKVNLLAVAQMLSARAIGGPEARENFGIRCLGRYTANNWKMLVPEAAMPRASTIQGRWQIVVAGQATETQVCRLTAKQAREFARVPDVAERLEGPLTSDVVKDLGQPALVTLRQAIDEGVLEGSIAAVRKRVQRDPKSPLPVARDGVADLYIRDELAAWAGSKVSG